MKLPYEQEGRFFQAGQRFESPLMGVIEGKEFDSAGRLWQSRYGGPCVAVRNGVYLPESGFWGTEGFGETFPLELEGRFIFFQVPVDH